MQPFIYSVSNSFIHYCSWQWLENLITPWYQLFQEIYFISKALKRVVTHISFMEHWNGSKKSYLISEALKIIVKLVFHCNGVALMLLSGLKGSLNSDFIFRVALVACCVALGWQTSSVASASRSADSHSTRQCVLRSRRMTDASRHTAGRSRPSSPRISTCPAPNRLRNLSYRSPYPSTADL